MNSYPPSKGNLDGINSSELVACEFLSAEWDPACSGITSQRSPLDRKGKMCQHRLEQKVVGCYHTHTAVETVSEPTLK